MEVFIFLQGRMEHYTPGHPLNNHRSYAIYYKNILAKLISHYNVMNSENINAYSIFSLSQMKITI